MMIKRAIVGIILVLVGITVTFYGFAAFQQTFPIVPATLAVVSTNCPTLVPVPSAIAPGSSGGISFGCSGAAAFKIANDGSSTPTFTLPAPYTIIGLVQSAGAPTSSCSISPGGPTVLTTLTTFSFTGSLGGGNSYNYCVMYSAANSSGLPQFTVSWSN